MNKEDIGYMLMVAATSCSHRIEREEITLRCDPKSGGNALAQLTARLADAHANIIKSVAVEPRAASIASEKFHDAACKWAETYGSADVPAYEAFVKVIDDHCAALVAQTESTFTTDVIKGYQMMNTTLSRDVGRLKTQLAAQTDARNLAITERVEITKYCDDLREQLAQARAASKPVSTNVEIVNVLADHGSIEEFRESID